MSVLGLVLLAAAGLLLLGELAAPGVGVAGAASAACLVLGVAVVAGDGPGPELAAPVAWPVAAAGAAGLVVAGRYVSRAARALPAASGPERLLHEEAVVRYVAGDRPQAFLAGAWWNVRSASGTVLAEGDRVWVVDVDGLDLVVSPLPAPRPPPDPQDRP